MRRARHIVWLIIVTLCVVARADDRSPPRATDAAPKQREAEHVAEDRRALAALPMIVGGVPLLTASTTAWTYQTVAAPRIPVQIGTIAAHASMRVDAGSGSAIELPHVLGPEAQPPRSWPYDVERPARGIGTLRPEPTENERIAAMFALAKFELRDEHTGLRVIEVRVRFRDGIIIWLNGVEVARTAIDGPSVRAFATRPHGPEWETFYVPAAPGLLRLGENVIAVEVHPEKKRAAPQLALDVVGRRDLGIVRGPIVGDLGVSTAVIRVETDPNLGATLEWGVGATLDHVVTSEPGRVHVFTLSGLPARTKVSYRVRAGTARTATYSLHTAPDADDVVRVGVYGDVRGGHDIHKRIVDAMLAEGLDLVAVTGDMVGRGSDEGDWQRFFTVTRELLAQVRYLPAIGNHDLGWNRTDPDVFALPPGPAGRPDGAYWYSLQIADVHLVFLDSNAYERVEQERWLDADLAAARGKGARAIIVLTHDGPYSRGIHRGNTSARDRYVPILVRHRVDLLLAGHDHLYQRGELGGLRYLVSGGGGAGLYRQSCGVAGKPKCPEDGMQKVAIEHHFVVLTIGKDTLEACPRRPDGVLLEPCQRYPLPRP